MKIKELKLKYNVSEEAVAEVAKQLGCIIKNDEIVGQEQPMSQAELATAIDEWVRFHSNGNK